MQKITLFFFLALGLCAQSLASAVIVSPYFNEFDSNDLDAVANFSPAITGEWLLASSNAYRNNILVANTTSSSTLNIGDLGGDNLTDFALSTSFTIDHSESNVGSNSIGLVALGSDPNAITDDNPFYLADVYLGGEITAEYLPPGMRNAELRLVSITASGPPLAQLNLNTILQEGVSYLLQLTGIYANNGDLNLNLSLSDTGLLGSINATVLQKDVLDGQYFGYRNRATGGAASALSVEFDSLAIIAIPEPSSIGFVAASLCGGYAIGMYLRRRIASQVI